MKILMIGRGVIATIYGWVLEKTGSQVEFYVRPGRAAQYGPSVNLEILDGRVSSNGTMIKQNWPVTMREDLNADHDYDLIIVSVNHNQLSDVITYLGPRIAKATVLIFNNVWAEPQIVVSALPDDQIVWGFPGGGGGFNAGTLKGGFMKLVFLGSIGGSNRTARYQAVRELFRKAGLSVVEPKDFRGWLWFHFVINTALAAQALKAGGYSKIFSSTAQLKEVVLLAREMMPLLKAKGDKPDPGVILLLHLPASLLGLVTQIFLSRESLGRFLMDQLELSGHASYELTSLYPRDVLADARRLGVLLPRLTSLEPVFK